LIRQTALSAPSRPDHKIKNKGHFEKLLNKTGPQPVALTDQQIIKDTVRKAAAKYNLPPALITAVIRAESNFEVSAVSSAGAQGLMQLMPATAKELGVKNSFDIQQNIDGGTKYLRKMLDRFGGSVRKALAAYNAGPGTVMKYNGRVPYPETRQYVKRVLRFSRQMT
jgi:soluble lytic murein transglycosylase-like protein